jgi:hydroxycarboxylate dehydrogenase B
MADLSTHTVAAAALRDFVTAIFSKAGCDAKEAAGIASHLIAANLAGHDSHGILRVPRYVESIRNGQITLGQTVTVVSESPTHAVLDGNHGFGQLIGEQAVDIGIAKAKKAGMAVVALRSSGHLGRIGDWGERAAEAGLVSIHFVNVENAELVAPFGGTGRRFSTNPVCIAIPPMAGRPMLLLDMATSVVAEGKVQVASNGGKPVPDDALIGADGKRTGDPSVIYGPLVPNGLRDHMAGTGAIRAFGEHKGSGLAFMCEMLGGLLTGGGTSGPMHPGRLTNGMLSIYLDPVHFGAGDLVQQAMDYVDYVKSSPTAEGVEEVLVPGEPEARNRAYREQHGVTLALDTWVNLCNVGATLGIAPPG